MLKMKFIKNYFLLVLEAVDVKSLLEQFEASETPNPRRLPNNKSVTKNNFLSSTKSNTIQMTPEYQSQVLKKSSSQICNQHTTIPDSVSKEVIDRIKVIILVNNLFFYDVSTS